jgi:cytochrome P450 family 6
VAQATQFFLAGFETSSSAITFALYELAVNQDIQRKLRKEIVNVLSRFNGIISYESLKEMEYLDMCVKETLRKYPVLPFLDRRNNTDYPIAGSDVVLEKGIPIFISIWALHFDSKFYPDPEKFDPTRFTEENVKSRPQFTYLPFGEGPRNCIGARFANVSTKSGIARIITNFEVDLCERTPHPIKVDPKGFLLSPGAALHLKFKPWEK